MEDALEKSWMWLCQEQAREGGLVRIRDYVRDGVQRIGQRCKEWKGNGKSCM